MRPNFHSVGGYDGMHLIYEAVKKAPNGTGEQLVEAMKGMKWVSPRGPMIDRPGDARRRADGLPARSEDGERPALEHRVRQDRERRARAARRSPRSALRAPPPGGGRPRGGPSVAHGRFDRRSPMIGNFAGVLFDGIAYGSLLFLISIGLSVTMGLMNFVNLAHGAFAMLGGYACVVLMTRVGVPFLADAAGRVRRRGARRRRAGAHALPRLYKAQPPRPGAVPHRPDVHGGRGGHVFLRARRSSRCGCPSSCAARCTCSASGSGAYRLFLIAVVVVITRRAAPALIERTRFGAQVRAAVDNQQSPPRAWASTSTACSA